MSRVNALKLAIVAFCCSISTIRCYEKDYCYAYDKDPYVKYATITSYEFVHAKSIQPVPNCKPISLWYLGRHGTRNPDIKVMRGIRSLQNVRDLILENHREKRGALCGEDLKNLQSWKFDIPDEKEKEFTVEGHNEMMYIAKRLKVAFPEILSAPAYDPRYKFSTSNTTRTIQSGAAFLEGLFGGTANPDDLLHKNESLLHGYKKCSKWRKEVADNDDTFNEFQLFQKEDIVKKLTRDVSARLGFTYTLDYETIQSMYESCRFEKAWNISAHPAFCAAFMQDQLKVLEYAEDLQYYFKAGYGREINSELGCPYVRDIFEKFNAIVKQDSDEPSATFYFTHSVSLISAATSLGINMEETKLLHDNYEKNYFRKWTTSNISPFSSNIVAVLYKCSEGEKYKVIFYLQENVVDYKGCDVGLCSWQYIFNKFAQNTDQYTCSFDSFCNYKSYGSKFIPCTYLISLTSSCWVFPYFKRMAKSVMPLF